MQPWRHFFEYHIGWIQREICFFCKIGLDLSITTDFVNERIIFAIIPLGAAKTLDIIAARRRECRKCFVHRAHGHALATGVFQRIVPRIGLFRADVPMRDNSFICAAISACFDAHEHLMRRHAEAPRRARLRDVSGHGLYHALGLAYATVGDNQ